MNKSFWVYFLIWMTTTLAFQTGYPMLLDHYGLTFRPTIHAWVGFVVFGILWAWTQQTIIWKLIKLQLSMSWTILETFISIREYQEIIRRLYSGQSLSDRMDTICKKICSGSEETPDTQLSDLPCSCTSEEIAETAPANKLH